MHEYKISLFDFTGDEVTEFVKFSETMTFNNDSKNDYDLYMDEKEFVPTEEQILAYDYLMKDWNSLYYNYWTPENPTEAYWIKNIYDFEEKIAPTSYVTHPWEFAYEPSWYELDENGLNYRLVRLVNAYVTNDTNFLTYRYTLSAAVAKPVIYLYPEKETDVAVMLDLNGEFTCTYPDYDFNNGWNVTAYPDGTVINKADGREYSYLYWEGKSSVNWDFSSGFVVKGSDTAIFLQEKLAYLGLKPREYNEFIVYWLPLMQDNPYNFITFQTTVYEENAKLIITPKPDSVLRVFMAYIPLEKPVKIPEQELKSFERSGFSVIEWGGTCAGR